MESSNKERENIADTSSRYGDRDFACVSPVSRIQLCHTDFLLSTQNWIGGEAVSLAINYTETPEFHAAGYAAIQTNDSFSGGQVRQYGNLSFNRVYQAGHEVPSYSPETSYRIFMRTLTNMDTATGTVPIIGDDGSIYRSEGPLDTWAIKNDPPEQRLQWCYLFDLGTCSEEQRARIEDGTAVLRNYIYVSLERLGVVCVWWELC